MASAKGSQLAALCAVSSFLWLAHNLEGHQLIEQPRLSSLLVLLISAISSYTTSFFALWLPGANGRFDDDSGPLRLSRTNLPRKPRRYFLPGLVICIILRVELFHCVSSDLQCSSPGIEAWLPVVVLLYELLPGRRAQSGSDGVGEKYPDDMGETMFDAFTLWFSDWVRRFSGSKITLSAGILTLTLGTYLVSSQDVKSTIFCSTHQSPSLVLFLQWSGLLLDAMIIIMLWRLLAWARTTKTRLKTLSGLLLASALGTGLLYGVFRQLQPSTRPMSYHFRGLDSLYVFDVVVDGLTFSTFLISTALLATEGSPLSLVGVVTFISGLVLVIHKTALVGTWENISPSTTYMALMLICNGFAFFVYANNLRSVVFVHRAFVVFFLIILTIAVTVYTLIMGQKVLDHHPLQSLIYDSRVEADRWLIRASVSDSFPVAVREYKERHNGRDPPPKFDAWYKFAMDRKSPIIDHFDQIAHDIQPFWGLTPKKLREDIQRIAAEPDIAVVKIRDGKLHHTVPFPSPHKYVLDDFVAMVNSFAEHLPENLELAINLNDRPRILAPWEDMKRFTTAGQQKGLGKLLSRRSFLFGDAPSTDLSSSQENYTTVRAFREMTALTCPPGTKARSGVHWDVRDFCSSCAGPQSQGHYLTDWHLSQEICHQSDLFRMHGFHLTSPKFRPLQELLPVFSRSKTSSYSDILIPLQHRDDKPEIADMDFDMKRRDLYWRGKLAGDISRSADPELLHGGHQERLVHLVNNASSADLTTILLPTPKSQRQFTYEQAPTAQLNTLLPMDIGFSACDGCSGVARSEFGIKPEDDETAPNSQSPIQYQYVLVTDTNDGPSRNLLRVLRSGSAPFLASIFQEWFSERLIPWVHFVPIDIRFHALHSTLAYFLGIKQKGGPWVNGAPAGMDRKWEDGKWIAEQGSKLAHRAMRREDMEVYLFRLLLEWARVVDDKREDIGFVSQ